MSKQEYEFHPYASVFPMMTATEFRELVADMQGDDGQREPITLLDGQILDGRNRYKACVQLGVEPKFRDFNGDGDPVDFIISMNLRRRQLNESQKGLVAAKIAALPRGNPALKKSPQDEKAQQIPNPPRGGFSEAQAAKAVGVSERTVSRGKKVLRDAPKADVKAIEKGTKTLGQVEKQIKQSREQTEKHVDKTGYLIPESILADWQRAEAFGSVLREISKVKTILKKGLEDSDLIFAEVNNTTVSTLTNAYGDLKRVLPYAVCSTCQGRIPKKCTSCRGRGFLSEFFYTTCVPEETRKIREKAIKK
jgi:hypothetical protein